MSKVFTEMFLQQKQKRFFRWYCATSHQTQVYIKFLLAACSNDLSEGAGDILSIMCTYIHTLILAYTYMHTYVCTYTYIHIQNMQDIKNYCNTVSVTIAYPSRSNRFFCSLKRPYQIWGPPNLLFHEYQGLCPGI